MKLVNLVSTKAASTVDDGKPLDNFFTTKKPKKKKKVPSVAKGFYGGLGTLSSEDSGDGDGGGE